MGTGCDMALVVSILLLLLLLICNWERIYDDVKRTLLAPMRVPFFISFGTLSSNPWRDSLSCCSLISLSGDHIFHWMGEVLASWICLVVCSQPTISCISWLHFALCAARADGFRGKGRGYEHSIQGWSSWFGKPQVYCATKHCKYRTFRWIY